MCNRNPFHNFDSSTQALRLKARAHAVTGPPATGTKGGEHPARLKCSSQATPWPTGVFSLVFSFVFSFVFHICIFICICMCKHSDLTFSCDAGCCLRRGLFVRVLLQRILKAMCALCSRNPFQKFDSSTQALRLKARAHAVTRPPATGTKGGEHPARLKCSSQATPWFTGVTV